MNNIKYVSTQVPITIEHFGVPGMRKGMRKQRPLNAGNAENEAEAAKTATQDSSTSKSPAPHHTASSTVKLGQVPMDSANTPKDRPEGRVVSEGDVLDVAKRTPFNAKYHEYSFSDLLNSVGDKL